MALGTTALAIMAGVSAVTSAVGAVQQGQAAKQAGRVQSDILRQDATRKRQESQLDADEFRRRQSRLLASQRAGFGASGVSTEGTPLFVGSDTAREIEFQAQKILVSGLTEATSLENEAGLARFKGKQAASAGFMQAGSTLLSGAARVGSFFEDGSRRIPSARSVDPGLAASSRARHAAT